MIANSNKETFSAMFVCSILAVSIVHTFAIPSVRHLPLNVGCLSDADCDPGSCCVTGVYKNVECQPTRAQGEDCSPAFEKVHDLEMTFPDGELTTLKVHRIYCGCSQGLQCNNGTCTKNP